MTYREAVRDFKEQILPVLVKDEQRRGVTADKPARREAWHVYKDGLHRDHQITDRQVQDWSAPDCCD